MLQYENHLLMFYADSTVIRTFFIKIMGIHIFQDNLFVLKQFLEPITLVSVFLSALNICNFSG